MSNTNTTGPLAERINKSAQVLGKSAEQVEQELSVILGPKSDEWMDLLASEEFTKFGDFMTAFGDKSASPSPIALVRKAVAILRGPEAVAKDKGTDKLSPRMQLLKNALGIKNTISTADASDLFKLYLADKPEDPVSLELKRRYGEQRVVAFAPDTKQVAVEETINYITDMAQGLPEQETVYVGGTLVRLYPVGKVPMDMVDEDPLFSGNPLNRDRSIVNNINWAGIDLKTRQLVRLASDAGLIDTDNRPAMIDLAKRAKEGGFSAVKELYPEAELEFRERSEQNSLPTLKMKLGGARGNSPFLGQNRRT